MLSEGGFSTREDTQAMLQSVTLKRTLTTHKKSQRLLVMARDVDQLEQDPQRVIHNSLGAQYQAVQDLLMQKSRELRDPLRNAGAFSTPSCRNWRPRWQRLGLQWY